MNDWLSGTSFDSKVFSEVHNHKAVGKKIKEKIKTKKNK
jgi:hypothetical protein